MTPEQFHNLRKLVLDDDAFERVKTIVLSFEKDRIQAQQLHSQASLLDQSHNAIIATDLAGTIIFWNQGAEATYQWLATEVLGKHLNKVIFYRPVNSSKNIDIFDPAQFQQWQGELIVQRKDGNQFSVEFGYNPIFDEQGQIKGICLVAANIDGQKEVMDKLAKSEQYFHALAQNHADGISILESDGTICYVSPSFEQIFGYKSADVIAKNVFDYIHPQDLAIIQERFANTLEEVGRVVSSEFRVRHADGSWIDVEATANSLLDELNIKRVVVNSRKITEQKQTKLAGQQQAERERLIGSIRDRIRESLDLEDILNTTAAEVRQFLESDRVLIFRFCPDWRGVVVVESVDNKWQPLLGIEIYDSCFAESYVDSYKHGRFQSIADIYTAGLQDCHIDLLAQLQVRANLVVPILQKEQLGTRSWELATGSNSSSFTTSPESETQLWGLLIAHQCSNPRQWQSWEINLLTSLSTQVGIAIQQAQLYKQTQLQAQREKALNRFTRTIRSSLDLEQIFATAAKEISQLLQIDYVEIQQYLPHRGAWLTVSDYRPYSDVPTCLGIEVPDVDNEVTLALKRLEVVRVNDTDRFEDEVNRQLAQIFPGAWLLVPLHFQERLWGRLGLVMIGRAYVWQDSEVELVEAIADQLAIAIQQAELYKQISTLNADLERQVNERTQQLEQKVQELQKLHILKDDFLSTVSHELRTPLSNMKMAIQMLKIAPNSDRRQRYMEILESECSRETELINDLLDLQRLEGNAYPVSLETVHLVTWLPNIIEPFRSRTQENGQILELDIPSDLPPVITDSTNLGRIMAELLNNACKYTPAKEIISFSARYYPVSSDTTASSNGIKLAEADTPYLSPLPLMTFTFSNQAEIPATELPRIFNKFYRVPNADPWKRGGTGLGLALVQKLVEQLEGSIEVESGNGWTIFSVTLPVTPGCELQSVGKKRLI
jgi:PAS domain S-box-containing protein